MKAQSLEHSYSFQDPRGPRSSQESMDELHCLMPENCRDFSSHKSYLRTEVSAIPQANSNSD